MSSKVVRHQLPQRRDLLYTGDIFAINFFLFGFLKFSSTSDVLSSNASHGSPVYTEQFCCGSRIRQHDSWKLKGCSGHESSDVAAWSMVHSNLPDLNKTQTHNNSRNLFLHSYGSYCSFSSQFTCDSGNRLVSKVFALFSVISHSLLTLSPSCHTISFFQAHLPSLIF